jgi:hypothetical protein
VLRTFAKALVYLVDPAAKQELKTKEVNPTLLLLNLKLKTRNPEIETRNLEHQTLKNKFKTLNPKP